MGPTGLPVADARGLLAPQQLLGTANHTIEEALESQAQGFDYVTVGPIFETGGPAVGVEGVRGIKELVAQPILATGGIDVNNVAGVVEAGADCAGVDVEVTEARDPEAATREIVEAIESARQS
jgi:thiamine-phosphate pyrophosphorylase